MDIYVAKIAGEEFDGAYSSLEKAEQAMKNHFEIVANFDVKLKLVWNSSLEWEYRIYINDKYLYYGNVIKYKLDAKLF